MKGSVPDIAAPINSWPDSDGYLELQRNWNQWQEMAEPKQSTATNYKQ